MKHLEVRQKYSSARRIFNSLLGVSSGDKTLRLMLGMHYFTVKHLTKKASLVLLIFQNRRRDSRSQAEIVREFSSCARIVGHTTILEMLDTIHENDLFNMFSVFSYVVQIPGLIPATVFCRAIIQCVAEIENLPPQHHGATTCAVTLHLLKLKGHMPTP